MIKFKISFLDNFTIEQRERLMSELSPLRFDYDKADTPLNGGLIIPTLIFCISFIAKPFFDAFLSEYGKDFHDWIKTKKALSKINKKNKINVSYEVIIENIRIIEYDMNVFTEDRHDSIIYVIKQIFDKCPNNLLPFVRLISLKYNQESKKYISALLYSTTGIPGSQVEGKLGLEPLIILMD